LTARRHQVRQLLGSPNSHDRINDSRTYWDYGGLIVYFADGHVVDTDVGA
jgi:prepilin-type processing-associated H-X9-DG protein